MSKEIIFPKSNTLDLPKELLKKLTDASNLIKSTSSPIKVISHYDADGLTAAAIICKSMMRLKKQFHISLYHGIEPNSPIFTELKNSGFGLNIFSDMGTGQLDDIEKLNGWTIILDHHKLIRDTDARNIIHINSNIFSIDGSYEISAATLAFLLAVDISPRNWDLISIALAGAIGDKQNKNGFLGTNLKLLNTALDLNILLEEINFKPHGNTIQDALMNSTDPYFVGLSNNANAINELLKSLKISPEDKIKELAKGTLQKLASYLAIKLLEQGVPPEDAEGVITKKYHDQKYNMELEEFSHRINACGRMNKMGVGVAAALGDPWALKYAKQLRSEYKEKIRAGLQHLEANRPTEMESIQYFFESVPEFAGTYAGIGMMYFFNQSKPVLALSKTDENIKVSGRGTKRLVDRGLDLAKIFAELSPEFNGSGGGHPIAAGATIALDTDETFLNGVDKMVGEQLNSGNDD